jgi:hypothetical protein
MTELPTVAQVLAHHREHTERTLARLRADETLTDYEKGQRITRAIADANARLVKLVRGGSSTCEPFRIVTYSPMLVAPPPRFASASQGDLR